ncbi:MAG: class I SAM-dependent methyltransferase [Candidatus Eisenbacteria bacterium]|nr:class I SAM-dependent methyltransferase [Candidatus Eisenbacteria bacterium]
MSTEWSEYWQDVANLRWTDVDQVVLERVANTLGWGPNRTLLELGAGRGLHSKFLFEMMRCDQPDLFEVSQEMLMYMRRRGLKAVGDESELRPAYNVVWSYGVPEHFEEPMRQQIIDRHFELSDRWVLLVIPRATWLRSMIGRKDRIPARDFTDDELARRLADGAARHWKGAPDVQIHVEDFCPLFGVRHIPAGWYNLVDRLIGWALPGGLLMGWAVRKR